MASPKTLNILGQAVAFDGKPRLEEVEAYVRGVKAAGEHGFAIDQALCIVREMGPAIINARLRPPTRFTAEPYAAVDKATSEGIGEVIVSIQETMLNPKLMAALGMKMVTPSAAK